MIRTISQTGTGSPERAARASDPNSQAVNVAGAETILYMAGQMAYRDNGSAAQAGDLKAQARAALQAAKAQVEAGGGTFENIVEVNSYLTDIRQRVDYAAIREEFFGKKMPDSTLVAIATLAQLEFLVEIESIAAI